MIHFSPDPTSLVREIASGDSSVYLVKFSDEITIGFKLPSREKMMKFMSLVKLADEVHEVNDIYEGIFDHYAIDSSILNHGDCPAGILESTVKLMFHLSGLMDLDNSLAYSNNMLDELREFTQNIPSNVMKQTICMVFPGYTFDILNKLDTVELYRIYVNAEQIAIKKGIIETELRIVSRSDKEEEPESVHDIMKSTNQELYRLDNQHDRVNIKDTAQWQRSYENTARKFSR